MSASTRVIGHKRCGWCGEPMAIKAGWPKKRYHNGKCAAAAVSIKVSTESRRQWGRLAARVVKARARARWTQEARNCRTKAEAFHKGYERGYAAGWHAGVTRPSSSALKAG